MYETAKQRQVRDAEVWRQRELAVASLSMGLMTEQQARRQMERAGCFEAEITDALLEGAALRESK